MSRLAEAGGPTRGPGRMLAMRASVGAAAFVIGACGGVSATPARSRTRIEGPLGAGAAAVWLLWPDRPARSVVVFAHGWKFEPPSPAHPWVGQFRPWLDHLLANGSAVIFPRYQLGGDEPGPERATSFRRGLELAFARLANKKLPVVAAGYSYGGSLVFHYAANARAWRLPQPTAVLSIFPVGPIPGASLPPLARNVDVLIEVGDRDTVAGRTGADAYWKWLSNVPASHKRLLIVRSTPGFAAVHAAPKGVGAGARRAFWTPLDELVARAVAARPTRAPRA